MFFRLFKYSLITSLRRKEIFFWNIIFPIILGTLFYVSFGNNMKNTELFRSIPVAYVETEQADEEFLTVLEEIESSEEPLVTLTKTAKAEAEKLLQDGEVEGIYENRENGIVLYVKKEGIRPSILKTVLTEYEKRVYVITDIAKAYPEKLQEVLAGIAEEVSMLKEVNHGSENMDSMLGYFYALIAMSCLYGCFVGVNLSVDIKANMSPLGARRVVASTNRLYILVSDITASILLQFCCAEISICYLKYVLGVEFGSKMPYMALVVLVGSIIGLATGFFIGSTGKSPREGKIGISVAVTMIECFLSGLMVGNMYHIIQKIFPLLNKINPAALIVDAFYSLDICDSYGRFYGNLSILLVISIVLCILSYLSIRRERYASL